MKPKHLNFAFGTTDDTSPSVLRKEFVSASLLGNYGQIDGMVHFFQVQ